MAHAGGRPPKWTPDYIANMIERFEKYIDETDIPIIQEFCYKNGTYKQALYDNSEFYDSLKRCIAKKEAALERMALSDDVNSTMAIFSLKQLGWRDKQSVELSGEDGGPIRTQYEMMTEEERQKRLQEYVALLGVKS